MNKNTKYTVFIADDHPLILSGLEKELHRLGDYEIIGSANDGQTAFDAIKNRPPQIAILDIQMPNKSGLEIAEAIQQNQWETKVILLTMFYELSFFEKAKQYDVQGYLLKDVVIEELEPCLNSVRQSQTYLSKSLDKIQTAIDEKMAPIKTLSRMEKKVFQLIGEGMTSKQIAELLFLSPRTIENHRYNICKKLELPGDVNSLYKFALNFNTQADV